MCTQTVGLVASELERQGIATVAIQLLREAAAKVGPPRGLWVPFPHGYPLGVPHAPAVQHGVIEVALQLLENGGLYPPVLVDYQPAESLLQMAGF
jgi:hypothetical protein